MFKYVFVTNVKVIDEEGNFLYEREIPSLEGVNEVMTEKDLIRLGFPPQGDKSSQCVSENSGQFIPDRKWIDMHGMNYDTDSGGYVSETPDSVQERFIAEELGMKQATIFYENVPSDVIAETLVNPHHGAQISQPAQNANDQEIQAKATTPSLAIRKKLDGSSFQKAVLFQHQNVELLPSLNGGMYDQRIATPKSHEPSLTAGFSAKDSYGTALKAENEVSDLLNDFIQTTLVRSFKGNMYIYNMNLGYYERYDDIKLKTLLDKKYGDEIMKRKNPTKIYEDLKDLLSFKHDIVIQDDYPSNPFLWAFRDIVLDIRSGSTIANNGGYFLTSCLQCNYDPNADCPNFDLVIKSMSNYDEQVEQLLWEVIGYILSPDTKAKKAFVFCGVSNSGKSLLANLLTDIIGSNSVSSLNINDFESNFGKSFLIGKRLNVCMDLEDAVLSTKFVGTLKMLTGDDNIHTDRKYKEPLEFKNTAKILLGTNHRLRTQRKDDPFNERLITIPFLHGVAEKDRNPYLLELMRDEYSGIVNKAIRYYLDLKNRNLVFTTLDPIMLPEAQHQEDPKALLPEIVSKLFEFTDDEADRVLTTDAHDLYCDYCNRANLPFCSQDSFSRYVGQKCIEKKKVKVSKTQALNAFIGLRIKS